MRVRRVIPNGLPKLLANGLREYTLQDLVGSVTVLRLLRERTFRFLFLFAH